MRTAAWKWIVAGLLAFGVGCATLDDSSSTSQPLGTPQGGRYLVKFRDMSQGLAALQAHGATVARRLDGHGAAAAHIPDAALNGLQHHPAIDYIEIDAERYPLSTQVTPYGITMVQADDPVFTAPPAKIKVCIIDSGFYPGHEDLAALTVNGAPGNLPWNVDGCGHGSHVAGTIAAVANDVGVVGVAPDSVELHIVRVFGDDCGWAYTSDLVAALDECRAAQAKVINMSLGGSFKSKVEEKAFNAAWDEGILSIAAAGNDGNTRKSYPASYASVVSVAAIDSNMEIAAFSQQNDAVDVAAPGVHVLSTVPWLATNTLTVDGVTYEGNGIEFAAQGAAEGALVDGGLCNASGSWDGKVVLCARGDISFYDKVHNVELGGGAAAIIYNNEPGNFMGTLGEGNTSTIPGISLSQEDGQYLVANKLGLTGSALSQMEKPGSGYEAWDGTSMATPHVVGVAALIWSYFDTKTNADIRAALEATALDLGPAGIDNAYGKGLVQARDAYDYLAGASTCTDTETDCGDGVDNDCDGYVDDADSDCASTCETTETDCGDGVDNDCDGLTDGADPDCSAPSCTPSGDACEKNKECCSARCDRLSKTCR